MHYPYQSTIGRLGTVHYGRSNLAGNCIFCPDWTICPGDSSSVVDHDRRWTPRSSHPNLGQSADPVKGTRNHSLIQWTGCRSCRNGRRPADWGGRDRADNASSTCAYRIALVACFHALRIHHAQEVAAHFSLHIGGGRFDRSMIIS